MRAGRPGRRAVLRRLPIARASDRPEGRAGLGGGALVVRLSQHPGGRSESRQATGRRDRKSTRLNSSHGYISYAVFCLKKKKNTPHIKPVDHRSSAEHSINKDSNVATGLNSATQARLRIYETIDTRRTIRIKTYRCRRV